MRTITHSNRSLLESFANEQGSELEITFERLWKSLARPFVEPVREFVFDSHRAWRFDFAWPIQMVAVEIEGGTRGRPVICHACKVRVRSVGTSGQIGRELRIGGRHTRGGGYQSDCDKYNAATSQGWSVLRFTAADLKNRPIEVIELTQTLIKTHAHT